MPPALRVSPTAPLFPEGIGKRELAEAQNFGAVKAKCKFAAAGPRNPHCTWLFLRSLFQEFLIATATAPADSCDRGFEWLLADVGNSLRAPR
jgi:hypothetical protein